MRWRGSDPVFWPPKILIGIAACCVAPQLAFAFVGWNVAAVGGAVAGISAWFWIGGRSSYTGFPQVFDALTLQVVVWSGILMLWVSWRWCTLWV